MKNLFLIMLVVFSTQLTFGQSELEIVKKQDQRVADSPQEYCLLMISNSECGHCAEAMENLEELQDAMQIVILDFGPDVEREKLSEKYKYVILNGHEIAGFKNPEAFPQLFLYKNNELIWKEKGWYNRNVRKINKFLNR